MLPQDELKDLQFNYIPTKRVSLVQILKQDEDDESIQKYKKSILGEIAEINEQPPQIEFVLMEVVFPNHPQRQIILDLQFGLKSNSDKPFQIKEGEIYQLRMHFLVTNDCVWALKFFNIVSRHSIKVDSYNELMGSYAPKKHVQIFTLQPQQAPSGFLSRGNYKGKAMFIDRDGIVHMQFEYFFAITKYWE